MQDFKRFLWVPVSVICGLLVFGTYTVLLGSNTSANPDYICIKSIENATCTVSSDADCGAWGTDGTRVCTGTKADVVAYFMRRTSCEPGYSQQAHGESNGSSGRQGADYVVSGSACTIVQVDNVPPVGQGTSN